MQLKWSNSLERQNKKIREKFEDRWNKVANELYSKSSTETLNKWYEYKDDSALIKDSEWCINLLLERIDHFASISLPNFKDNSFENLIDNDELLAKIKKNVREDWELKLKNTLSKIKVKRFIREVKDGIQVGFYAGVAGLLILISWGLLYAAYYGNTTAVKAFEAKGSAVVKTTTSGITVVSQLVTIKTLFKAKRNIVASENAGLLYLWNELTENVSIATFIFNKLYEMQYHKFENKKEPPRLKINEFEAKYSLSECEMNYIQ